MGMVLTAVLATITMAPTGDAVCDIAGVAVTDLLRRDGAFGIFSKGVLIRTSDHQHQPTVFDRCPTIAVKLPSGWQFEDEAQLSDHDLSSAHWIGPPEISADGKSAIVYFGGGNAQQERDSYQEYRLHGRKWKKYGQAVQPIIV